MAKQAAAKGLRSAADVKKRLASITGDDKVAKWRRDTLSPYMAPGSNRDRVVERMRGLMANAWMFASGKHESMARVNTAVLTELLWVIGDDDLVKYAEDTTHFDPCGEPILLAMSKRYGFSIPTSVKPT
ncbi:MAG: hypothetical protein HY261_04970 [Chloroflexi bacterium]|nr:hypothetical protein [Chloroflexota bacterium]